MVAIISGKGIGLERSSAWVLGSQAQLGSAGLGRGGDNVYVNANTGNLVITRQDEFLIGRGEDIAIDRTYNSQTVAGITDGDNNDQWRMGVYRKITSVSGGAYGSTFSSVKRIDWDGSDTLYQWDATRNAYLGKEGAGAYDTLSRTGTTWTWTDGDTQTREYYDDSLAGRLTSTVDRAGSTLLYNYNGSGLITRVTSTNSSTAGTTDDEYTDLVYSGTLLTQITTSTGSGLTRVFYEYDTSGRLSKVKVNLDPTDNSAASGSNYETTYAYDGSSKRVTQITQSDGSSLTIGYTLSGSIYKVTSLTQAEAAGVNRVTTISYASGQATVLDAAGNISVFNMGFTGDLAKLQQGTSYQAYSYDANGSVAFVDDGPTTSAQYDYDANGNRIREVDRSGNTITRTYSLTNQLVRETRYATPDPDGFYLSGQPGSPMTTRYAYDGSGHLRYAVSAEGHVTEYVTELGEANLGYGKTIATIDYGDQTYSVSSLAPETLIQVSQLDDWVAAIGADKSGAIRTETSYDFRGNVTAVKSYSKLLGNGQFDTSSELSHTIYVYDQAGNLLNRHLAGSSASEVFVYDGLNRLITSTDFNSTATNTVFYDSTDTKVVSYANGLVATSLYNLAGDLITYTEAGPSVTSAVTNYRYDGLGRLRVTIDALGQRDYFYYDQMNRKIGDIDSDGSATEYRYDDNNNLASVTRYATRLTGTALSALADSGGNPTSIAFAGAKPAPDSINDRWTWYQYDSSRRLVRMIDATGAITDYGYDAASRLLSTTRYSNLLPASTLVNMKSQNLWANSGDGTLWQTSGLSVASSGTINGATAYKFTTTSSSGYEAVVGAPTVVSDGDTVTFTVWVKGFGSTSDADIGIQGSATGWGPGGDSTAYTIDASYSSWVEQISGGLFRIHGLSATAVPVIVTRTFRLSETATSVFYVQDSDQHVPTGSAAILAAPKVTVTPNPSILDSDDRIERNFYDGDDRLVATLDGEGFLTEIFYDGAGRKVRTIAYANAAGTDEWRGGSLDALRASIAIDNARDVRNYFLYDARGMLRATVDGEGDLTRYRYTPLGDIDQIVTGQKLDPATLVTTPPTLAGLPNPPAGTILETISYTRNLYGQVLAETRSLTGTTSTTTAYTYDSMRRLVSITTQSGGSDPTILNQRYDARGRLKAELSGIGGAVLAALLALDPDPDEESTDPIWAQYATFYSYDGGGRLIAKSYPNGARTLYYYDADDRLACQVDALGDVVEYRYDAFGERTDTIVHANRIDAETLSEMTGGRVADISTTIGALADAAADQATHLDFNLAGTVSQATDPLGHVSTFTYNPFGELETETDPLGAGTAVQTSRAYDRRGLLRSETVDSAEGGKFIFTSYGYDAFGRPVVLTDPNFNTTFSTFDRAGRLTAKTDALGQTTSFDYDARGNLVAVTDALGHVTRYVYDNGDRRIWSVDATGGVVQSIYDDDGRVVATKAFATRISLSGLPHQIGEGDIAARLTADTQHDRTMRYAYDKDGRLRFALDSYLSPIEYSYDNVGNLIRTTVYSGSIDSTASYTADYVEGQITAHGLTALSITRTIFDSVGHAAFGIDGVGAVTQFTYDSASRLVTQRAFKTLFTADGDPDQVSMQDWANANADTLNDHISRAVYDQDGRLAYSIDAEGYVTERRYDRAGNVSSEIHYVGQYSVGDGDTMASLATLIGAPATAATTSFLYDSAGRLRETIDAMGTHTTYTLDQVGQIVSSTAAVGLAAEVTTTREYDELGRLHSETRAAGTADEVTALYDYDAINETVSATVAYGTDHAVTTSWLYDAAGQVTSETRAAGTADEVIIGYGHNAFGEVSSTTLAAGTGDAAVTSWTYDQRGQVDLWKRAEGTAYAETIDYDYDALGRLRFEHRNDGTMITRDYDAAGNLKSVHMPVDATPANDLVTGSDYDAFGNVKVATDARGNATNYVYDRLNRVVSQTDAEAISTTTSYTWSGQIHTVTRGSATTTFIYDKLSRLTDVTDAENHNEHYQLDALGNRTQLVNKLSGITDYTYDALGRVKTQYVHGDIYDSTGTWIAAGAETDFDYDKRGNLVSKTEGVGLGPFVERHTIYGYDQLDRLIQVDHPDVLTVTIGLFMDTSLLSMVDSYSYDARGNVIATRIAGSPATYCYYDLLDRRTDEIDQTGKLSHWDYDLNGNVHAETVYGDPVTFPSTRPAGAPSPVDPLKLRKTTFTYDKANRLTDTTGPSLTTGHWDAATQHYLFDTGPIVQHVDYDDNGNVIRISVGGVETRSFYDAADRKIGQLDAEGYLTVWERDAEGNVLTETRFAAKPAGPIDQDATVTELKASASATDARFTEFTYDPNGRRRSETRLGVIAYSLGSNGALPGSGTATVSEIQYEYNAFGEVTRKLEANGDETLFTYDNQGRLTRTKEAAFTDDQGATVRPTADNLYDAFGDIVVSSVSKEGGAAVTPRVTRYSYNQMGWLELATDAAGNTHFYTYDAGGRMMKDEYQRLKSTGSNVTQAACYVYDVAGRLIRELTGIKGNATPPATPKWSLGDTTYTHYNVYGDMISRGVNRDAAGNESQQETFEYDLGGRLWRTTGGDGTTRLLFYDAQGNVTLTLSSAGANLTGVTQDTFFGTFSSSTGDTGIGGAVTTIGVFDKRGQQIATIEPHRQINSAGGGTFAAITNSRSYNAFGEVKSETDARSHTTDFVYNTMGRLVQKLSPTVDWTDEHGTIASARPTENYYYDISGRMIGVRDANGHDATRALLAGTGNGGSDALVTAEYHADGHISTFYDGFREAVKVRDAINRDETYGYDAMGRITSVTHIGGLLTDHYIYDSLGERTGHWNSLFGSSVVERTDYDSQGRVVSQVDFAGGATTTQYLWDTSITDGALGDFDGWTKTISNPTGHSSSESTDYFGRTISRADLGIGSDRHTYAYSYDYGGRLSSLTNSAGASLAYTYFNTGRLSSLVENGITATYGYDENGNKTRETYGTHENATVTYDALNRRVSLSDSGEGGTAPLSVAWEYDLVGNVRHMLAGYTPLTGSVNSQDYWYAYDAMDRVTLAMGSLSARGSGTVERGKVGTDITWDAANQRRTETQSLQISDPNHTVVDARNYYSYGADGYLASYSQAFGNPTTPGAPANAPSGPPRASYTRDDMGRVTTLVQDGQTTTTEYNVRSQVISQSFSGLNSQSTTTFDYNLETSPGSGVYTGAYAGVMTHSHTTGLTRNEFTGVWSTNPDSDSSTTYVWWDSAQQNVVTNSVVGGSSATSTYHYDSLGHVVSVDIGGQTVNYITNPMGQILQRSGGGFQVDRYSYFDSKTIGYVSNGEVYRRYNNTLNADFDQNYEPLASTPQGADATYTVQGGDTLRTIADGLWGDAGLWYLIANANGLNGSETLAAGMVLTIPAKVTNLHNNAGTFQVYDPNKALGDNTPVPDASPLQPAPPKHGGCGIVGQILVAVVAVAVSIALPHLAPFFAHGIGLILGGAIASTVSQGVGIATGVQDKFSFKGVALAALSAGVGVGLDKLPSGIGSFLSADKLLSNVVRGVASSAISQGIGVVTGLQDKFSWAGVAAAGVSAGVAGAIGRALPQRGPSSLGELAQAARASPSNPASHPSLPGLMLGGAAGAVASAAARSIIEGTDFGDNILAALPDVIANTIGLAAEHAWREADLNSATERAIAQAQPDLTPDQIKTLRAEWDARIADRSSTLLEKDRSNPLFYMVSDAVPDTIKRSVWYEYQAHEINPEYSLENLGGGIMAYDDRGGGNGIIRMNGAMWEAAEDPKSALFIRPMLAFADLSERGHMLESIALRRAGLDVDANDFPGDEGSMFAYLETQRLAANGGYIDYSFGSLGSRQVSSTLMHSVAEFEMNTGRMWRENRTDGVEHYGLAGHYHTTFLVAFDVVNAAQPGHSDAAYALASLLALGSQIPDMYRDTDAYMAEVDNLHGRISSGEMADIQNGLHSLFPENAPAGPREVAANQRWRSEQVIGALRNHDYYLAGIQIHGLADSFAHTDSNGNGFHVGVGHWDMGSFDQGKRFDSMYYREPLSRSFVNMLSYSIADGLYGTQMSPSSIHRITRMGTVDWRDIFASSRSSSGYEASEDNFIVGAEAREQFYLNEASARSPGTNFRPLYPRSYLDPSHAPPSAPSTQFRGAIDRVVRRNVWRTR